MNIFVQNYFARYLRQSWMLDRNPQMLDGWQHCTGGLNQYSGQITASIIAMSSVLCYYHLEESRFEPQKKVTAQSEIL